MGLKRLPHRPLCGPLLSKLSASENTFPLRMRPAALMMSCGDILFSVPASSSAPQRPQFFKRSPAAWISWSVTLSFGFVMSLDPLSDGYNHAHKLIDYHDRKFQTFAFIRPTFEKFGLSWRRRLAGATKPSVRSNFFDWPRLLLELSFATKSPRQIGRRTMESKAVGMIGLGIM